MVMKIGINGFGRIGRMVFRIMEERSDMEVVAINDLAPAASLGHLLKYDSVHGRFGHSVQASEGKLEIGSREVAILSERDPAELPWSKFGVDFVVESTGFFKTQEACEKHISAGAPKVLLTVPPSGDIDRMVVLGVNNEALLAGDKVISNASCTTNCLAPVAKVLHDSFGIENGLVTTVHAYTNDQKIADQIHSDLRRARAGAQNIIPTSTGAARAVGKVLPELNGKLDGMAMRVPVPNGSVVDLVATLSKSVSKDDINKALQDAAAGPMKGILAYTEDPIVSTDIIGNPHSSIADGLATMSMGKVVKVVSWYDNEWGYSNRVCDLVAKAHGLS